MIDSFFSYTNSKFSNPTVQYSILSVGDVTEVDVYSQWRAAVQINLKQRINNALNNEV